MTLEISYMGTKKQLAPHVFDLCEDMKKGAFLDLFSGVCAVGSELSTKRDIWCNDALLFPHLVAKTLFKSKRISISDTKLTKISSFFHLNYKKLKSINSKSLKREEIAIEQKDADLFQEIHEKSVHVGNNSSLQRKRRKYFKEPNKFPYCLFTITFNSGYFGVKQCMEIDSIRYAIDQAYETKIINKSQKDFLLIALCQTISKASTSPGHFAQYIKPKYTNVKFYSSQRKIEIYTKWLEQIKKISSLIDSKSVRENKAFHKDANDLLSWLKSKKYYPGIIYADPPYTADQYSRYYHVYDTLLKYDYPESFGQGRYRPDRFRSNFCLKRDVDAAFENLISGSALLKSDILISYPSKGFLENSTETIIQKLSSHYKNFGIAKSIEHSHSTMGGSKGSSKNKVEEIIFYGSEAR